MSTGFLCLFVFYYKGDQNPHIKLILLQILVVEINQWKLEENRAKNREVTAFWNLAITRGW